MRRADRPETSRPQWRRWAIVLALAALGGALAPAQEDTPQSVAMQAAQSNSSAAPSAEPATVRGTVRNSQSGAPIARVLVKIEGDASTGVFTNADGQFELDRVPSEPQIFSLQKPGFLDFGYGQAAPEDRATDGRINAEHNVIVARQMKELNFFLTPASVLRGRVQFATGEPASSVSVLLAWRTVEDGRPVWQMRNEVKTRADGGFRFAGLPAGSYAVFTEPIFDTDADTTDSAGTDARERRGYPAIYYPDAHSPAEMAAIALAAGQELPITLTLSEASFHRMTVPLANPSAELLSLAVRATVANASGQALAYPCRYDASRHTIETWLPDGSYRMLIGSAVDRPLPNPQRDRSLPPMASVEFTVAGKARILPRATLLPQPPSPIAISLPGGAPGKHRELSILAYPATGWIDDGLAAVYANGKLDDTLLSSSTMPGAYWLAPQMDEDDFCEDSFTANGAPLAHGALHVGASGTAAPLILALRRDCAKLRLRMPDVPPYDSGEEPFYTAYVVPDFDFTHSLRERTLRPSSGAGITIAGLTPGSYHVYLFSGARRLAYRDAATLSTLRGQPVTLSPSSEAEISLELPAQ